ncbi:hypothetical protein [Bacillus paramycoides]|uniref:hypothetical protein n=1 Tax=Bacillus paramycoides TaxID=2026194 RepID=UPI003D013C77
MKFKLNDPTIYNGIEDIYSFVARVFHFILELESRYDNTCNILLLGHRCTTGFIGAYFEGVPKDNNNFHPTMASIKHIHFNHHQILNLNYNYKKEGFPLCEIPSFISIYHYIIHQKLYSYIL